MTRFTDRVTRDLHQIADRSTPSSTAWDSIRTRIDEQADQPPTMEVIMLSPDRNDSPKRGWMLAAAAVAGLALVGGLVFATTRSDDTAPADTPVATLPAEPAPDAGVEAPATTKPVVQEGASAAIVFEGTYSDPNDSLRPMPGGVDGTEPFTNSASLDGDLVGNGAFLGAATPGDGSTSIEGDWVFSVTTPDGSDGLLAVQQWSGVLTETDFGATGEVTGLSGPFTDTIGTITFAGEPGRVRLVDGELTRGPNGRGTYVIELRPAAPSLTSSAPTEAITIEFVTTATTDMAWLKGFNGTDTFGGGATATGDVVGSLASIGTATGEFGTPDFVQRSIGITVATLVGRGDGTFVESEDGEFYGVSGVFAGLRGTAISTVDTVLDANGFFAPIVTRRYELSR